MATKKPPPTLTKPWRSVTDLKASLLRAREAYLEVSKRPAEMNVRVAKRRERLCADLRDLTPKGDGSIGAFDIHATREYRRFLKRVSAELLNQLVTDVHRAHAIHL